MKKLIIWGSMKKLIFITIFSTSAFSHAQSIQKTESIPVLQKFTDDYLNQYKQSEYISTVGMTLQCLDNSGKIFVSSAYSGKLGFGNNPIENKNTDKDDIFQIGSISKSFISVVLLQLEGTTATLPSGEKHIFSLDDEVEQWFPEYGNWYGKTDDKGIYHPLLIRQLLNMTSGIPEYTGSTQFLIDLKANPYQYSSLIKILSYESNNTLEFVPGSKWEYSNTNYTLAGLLIEKITGNSYLEEVKKRIFNKLELNYTFFPKNYAKDYYPENKLVRGYAINNPKFPFSDKTDTTDFSLSWENSGGGIISNTTDINKYIQALFTPNKLLSNEKINELETNAPGIICGDDQTYTCYYGLGIVKNYDKVMKENFYEYEGGTFGFRFIYFYYPKRPLNLVFAINSSSGGENDHSVLYLYDQIIPKIWETSCFSKKP